MPNNKSTVYIFRRNFIFISLQCDQDEGSPTIYGIFVSLAIVLSTKPSRVRAEKASGWNAELSCRVVLYNGMDIPMPAIYFPYQEINP